MTSKDLRNSLTAWLKKINKQKAEIKFLGERTVKEIANVIADEDYQPVMLKELKNIWFMHVPTKQGGLNVNIIKTDVF